MDAFQRAQSLVTGMTSVIGSGTPTALGLGDITDVTRAFVAARNSEIGEVVALLIREMRDDPVHTRSSTHFQRARLGRRYIPRCSLSFTATDIAGRGVGRLDSPPGQPPPFSFVSRG